MSQSVDVARWVRSAIEHAQDVLSVGLGQQWGYNFVFSFLEGPVLVHAFGSFHYWFFSLVVLVMSCCQISTCLFWVCFSTFRCFFCVFRLKSILQKNKLSSSKLVLIQFSYCGFLFQSHALRLWFGGKVSLRWLVWIII